VLGGWFREMTQPEALAAVDAVAQAGLDVEGARFASAQQVAEAMVATAAARAR
jgi:hypothetical protein